MSYRSRSSSSSGEGPILIGLILFLVFGVGGCNAMIALGTTETVTADITSVERVTTGSGDSISSKYLVYTNTETFKNSDTMWHGKWNSSDLHGKLKSAPGRYKLFVYGWRLPFFSTYRNIIKVTKVSTPSTEGDSS